MSLSICVIGCGNHSALVHGPSCQRYVREFPDTILAACCDLDAEKAEAYRARFGFRRCYTDMANMLRLEKPDAVCVIVPENAICRTGVAVMDMGYHVLLEKPPGLDSEETGRLIEAADRNGVISQVAFNRRYHPMLNALKEMIDRQKDRPLQTLFYDFFRFGRTEPTFYTTAIHGIDAAKYLADSDYAEVRFTYQELPSAGEGVLNILMDCRFENGVIARLNFCPVAGTLLERITANQTDHSYFLKMPIWNGPDMPGELQHIKNAQVVESLSGLDVSSCQDMYVTDGFYAENRAFFETVRTGKKTPNDIRSAFQSVQIAEAIRNRESGWTAGKK